MNSPAGRAERNDRVPLIATADSLPSSRRRLAFLLRRRLALAFTAVPHGLFNIRRAQGRRVDFEQRVFRPLKDLPIEFIGSLSCGGGRSGQSRSPAPFLRVVGIENN